MAYVINHPEMGVYLGCCMGLGFWSQLDPAGQESAVVFPNEAKAEAHMASWDDGRPGGAVTVAVVADEDKGQFASMAACIAAGLDAWVVDDDEEIQ